MKELDPITQEKQDALQLVISGCVFAPSASALAKRLGYKGKTSIYRIQQGEASAGAIEEAWKKLVDFMKGTDEQLFYAARAVKNCRALKRLAKEEGREEIKPENQHLWVLRGVMKGDAERFSEKFQREVWPDLMDLRTEDTDVFWMMMAFYYFDGEGVDAYGKDFRLLDELNKLHRWLQQNYENSEQPRSSINNVFRKDYIDAYSQGCTWDLMFYGALALIHYAEPDSLDRTVRIYDLYNLGDDSYWIVPGTIYKEGAHVWHLIELQVGGGTHGLYYAVELEMGRNKEEFAVMQIIPMLFSESLEMLQMEVTTERKPIIAQYEWNTEHTILQIKATKEEHAQYGIPTCLHRIDLANPQGKDEKIWAHVMRGYDNDIPDNVMSKLAAFEGIEYQSEYRIRNVTIDRHTLTIAVEKDGECTDYVIDIERYDFLKTLLPSDIIGVVRLNRTGQLSFRWVNKAYVVPMEEFQKYYSNKFANANETD